LTISTSYLLPLIDSHIIHWIGTHVGSLAAGKTFGVAKQAQVYSLRVLDCSGLGTLSVVVRAIGTRILCINSSSWFTNSHQIG